MSASPAARGRRIRYIDLPVPLYRLSLRLAGVDRRLRDSLVTRYAAVVAKGHDMTHEVHRITGWDPIPFATWAKARYGSLSVDSDAGQQ